VALGVCVSVAEGVGMGVAVDVAEAVFVAVCVGVLEAVAVIVLDAVAVAVLVAVAVAVGVFDGVAVGVRVGVFEAVAVLDAVTVGVRVGVLEAVTVDVKGVKTVMEDLWVSDIETAGEETWLGATVCNRIRVNERDGVATCAEETVRTFFENNNPVITTRITNEDFLDSLFIVMILLFYRQFSHKSEVRSQLTHKRPKSHTLV
jgi:hypothetical protein